MLKLSPLAAADLEALTLLLSEEHMQRYLVAGVESPRAFAEAWLEASLRNTAAGELGLFMARRDSQVVGFVGFDGKGLLVFGLHQAHGMRGLATEMVRQLLDTAFATVEVVRAQVDWPNVAGVRLLERLGMSPDGTSPGAAHKQLHFVMTRQRWQSRSR